MAASQHNVLVLWAGILRFLVVWLLADLFLRILVVWLLADLLDLQGRGLRSLIEWQWHYHAQCDVPHGIGDQRP